MRPTRSANQTTAAPMLDMVRAGWLARGWNLADLDVFRNEDPPAPPTPPAPTPPVPPAPTPPAVQFTADQLAAIKGAGFLSQDDVSRIAAAEKDQGKRQAEKELADALGVTPEEAKAIIEAHKKAETDAMTEAQRAAHEAAEDRKKAAKELADARADRRNAAVHTALVLAGIVVPEGQNGADVLARVGSMVALPADTDVTPEQVTAAVTQLKELVPALFTAATPPAPTPRVPSSLPGGGPPAPKPPEGVLAAAFEKGRAAARQNPRQPAVAANNGAGK